MLKEGKIDGIIFCSDCITDLPIEAIEWTRNWLFEHMDDEIESKKAGVTKKASAFFLSHNVF